jgi:hypothetical protein
METNARSSATDTDASVAQPAPIIALHNVGTAPPAVHGPTHKLAFYNVGWQPTSNMHNAAWLAREVHDIVTNGNVDAVGISEVFNIRDDLNDTRNDIMSQILGHLNQSNTERPAWEGKTDVHHIFIWKDDPNKPKKDPNSSPAGASHLDHLAMEIPPCAQAEVRANLRREFEKLASNQFDDEIAVATWVRFWVGAIRLGVACRAVAPIVMEWAEEVLAVWPRGGNPEKDEEMMKAIRDWCGKVAVKKIVEILMSSVIEQPGDTDSAAQPVDKCHSL